MAKKPLENLMDATIETIIEAIEHKPWHAFINNGVVFTGVAINHEELYAEILAVKENPSVLIEMEKRSVEKFGKKKSNRIASIIFRHVWAMIMYNLSSILEIAKELKELKESPLQG